VLLSVRKNPLNGAPSLPFYRPREGLGVHERERKRKRRKRKTKKERADGNLIPDLPSGSR
jgi:hypothetical protein